FWYMTVSRDVDLYVHPSHLLVARRTIAIAAFATTPAYRVIAFVRDYVAAFRRIFSVRGVLILGGLHGCALDFLGIANCFGFGHVALAERCFGIAGLRGAVRTFGLARAWTLALVQVT